jgi:hypothetical protein
VPLLVPPHCRPTSLYKDTVPLPGLGAVSEGVVAPSSVALLEERGEDRREVLSLVVVVMVMTVVVMMMRALCHLREVTVSEGGAPQERGTISNNEEQRADIDEHRLPEREHP